MCEGRETDIRGFLKEFKKIMVRGRGLDIIPRRETMKALADLGLTKNNELPRRKQRGIKEFKFCHSALDAESRK